MGCTQSTSKNAVNGKIPRRESISKNSMSLAQIESRIDCISKTKSACFGGARVRFAYMSQRGYYPDDEDKPNQDAYCIREGFCEHSKNESDIGTNAALLAVFDGHGRFGDKCAQFAKTNLPLLLERSVEKQLNAPEKAKKEGDKQRGQLLELASDEYQKGCMEAHLECNRMMHRAQTFDDSLSGTTAISLTFHGNNHITVCNVGDSRAIVGQRVNPAVSNGVTEGGNAPAGRSDTVASSVVGGEILRALPLSLDQTPYRKDERCRVRKCGARIMSLDQIEGLEPMDDDNSSVGSGGDLNLGETIDEGGDPPRVWSPQGEYPGTAFTRSIGDMIAEELGVCAEPEMISRKLSREDKIIVLASDGVFEFLTNQSVIDICAKFDDPLEACRAVVAESYELWLQYELRTDDITMICIFVDDLETPSEIMEEPEGRGSSVNLDLGANVLEGMRPVRKEPTKKKMKAIENMRNNNNLIDIDEDEDFDITQLMTEKSDDDKELIADAIKTTVIFKDISEEQREMIFAVMEPVSVKKGDWVIRQGDLGDRFYIVDTGEFEVRIVPPGGSDPEATGGNLVHLYVGSRQTHAHPSFGELALMYSAPRAASIIAQTDGQVWALHRAVYNKILSHKKSRREIRQFLRKLQAFKALSTDEVNSLADSMEEVTYEEGNRIVTQSESGDSFYFIVGGTCEHTTVAQPSSGKSELDEEGDGNGSKPVSILLKANDYFGEEMLLNKGQYEATVVAKTSSKLLVLSLSTVEQKVGSLVGRHVQT